MADIVLHKALNPPVVLCEEFYVRPFLCWRFFCTYCLRYHYHGAGPGHCSAHCSNETPYRETGYILKLSNNLRKPNARTQVGRKD